MLWTVFPIEEARMTGKITTLEASDNLHVLGETLRPLLTNAMGSPIEIFDTRGPMNAGALEVRMGSGEPHRLATGAAVHIPAGVTHSYRNLSDDTHFLTIVTRGNADKFFHDVSANVAMNPPDVPEIIRVGARHGIDFV
jgi:hypothetical protein